jgi:hypothetical protein
MSEVYAMFAFFTLTFKPCLVLFNKLKGAVEKQTFHQAVQKCPDARLASPES